MLNLIRGLICFAIILYFSILKVDLSTCEQEKLIGYTQNIENPKDNAKIGRFKPIPSIPVRGERLLWRDLRGRSP